MRLSNIYGPTPLKRWDLIHVLIHQLFDQGRGKIWSAKPERDFIYVEDAAHAVVKLLETGYTGTLNLGTGTITSIGQVIQWLSELSGCPIEVMDQPVQGPMRFQCDMTTMRKLIDWSPQYSTEAGVRKTFELMKSWRESAGRS